MRRLALALTLAALALGSFPAPAEAKCPTCLDGISVQTTDGRPWTQGKPIALVVSARRGEPGRAFPETGAAVMMNADGNRTKCITIPLKLVAAQGDSAMYAGLFYPFQLAAYDGKLQLGDATFDFAFNIRTLATTTAPARTPDLPSAQPEEPPASWALTSDIGLMPFLGGALLFWVAVGVVFERRRAIARRSALSASTPAEG
jgi:hypothetical protein